MDPGELEHRARRTAGNDAGPRGRGPEHDALTVTMFFFALSTALRIASVTSFALPMPMPTWVLLSPTATSALNPNRLPPLTTLATRLTAISLSTSSDPPSPVFVLLNVPLATSETPFTS
jgi:hypothetical protein